MKILVTGGAGFIGSHLTDSLVAEGHNVTVLDNLEPQVHGASRMPPDYLNKDARFIKGDIRDDDCLKKALKDVEVIFHQAAMVGVEQSIKKIKKCISVNTLGTAVLLQTLQNSEYNISKLIVASSVSVYGEGKYYCESRGEIFPKPRPISQLNEHKWEMKTPGCKKITPAPIDEKAPLNPLSIYGITKRDQEQMCLQIGKIFKIPTVALRYFNVYGPRQAPNNPYSGAATIFSARLLNNEAPLIFEDGLQSRDFVYVKDVVQANILAMKSNKANYTVFNVGTGKRTTIIDMANTLASLIKPNQRPVITNEYRIGDIRHSYAQISKIKNRLGYKPKTNLYSGLKELVQWFEKKAA